MILDEQIEQISIHALLAESDVTVLGIQHRTGISIHALLAESDTSRLHKNICGWGFLSTLSLRRATYTAIVNTSYSRFLSTLSLRRATRHYLEGLYQMLISIHALLAESDHPITIFVCVIENFYPRSPCGERLALWMVPNLLLRFLSTLSLRRATLKPPVKSHRQKHFYPRSPCGERLRKSPPKCSMPHFYPRSPCGERPAFCQAVSPKLYFYPRSPCGERPALLPTDGLFFLFLSTLSLRRATTKISIKLTFDINFYPRSPCGERHKVPLAESTAESISIHALLAESDLGNVVAALPMLNFYPRSPCGERRGFVVGSWPRGIFLSTLSLRRATDCYGLQYVLAHISIHALLAESDLTV